MNANLTLNGLVFTEAYSDKDGSVRRNAGLGANMPRVLSISHTEAIDSRTKLATRRSLVRFDQPVLDADGNPLAVPVSLYLVAVIPDLGDPTLVTNAISDCKVAMRQMISPTGADASALDLFNDVFVTQAQ